MNVAYQIRMLRSQKQMTQDELAEKLCVTRQTISNWETGKSEPDFESLEMLSKVFEVSAAELLGEEPNALPALPDPEDNADSAPGKGRFIVIGVLGFFSLLTLLDVLFVAPKLLEYSRTTYIIEPRMINELAVIPVGCFLFGMLIPACLMLKKEPELKRPVRGIVFASALLVLFPLIMINLLWIPKSGEMTVMKQIWRTVFNYFTADRTRVGIGVHLLPFLSGLLMMSGFLAGSGKKVSKS